MALNDANGGPMDTYIGVKGKEEEEEQEINVDEAIKDMIEGGHEFTPQEKA